MAEEKIENSLNSIIYSVLEEYDKVAPKELKPFLLEQLKKSQVYSEDNEMKLAVDELCSTIDDISRGYLEIQQYKKVGRSLNAWLKDKLTVITEKMTLQDKNIVISVIKDSLRKSNSKFAETLTGEVAEEPLLQDLSITEFSGFGKNAIVDNLRQELVVNTGLGHIMTDVLNQNGLLIESPQGQFREIPVVREYFKNALDAESDDDLKKVIAVSLEIARKRDLLPEILEKYSPMEMAAIADKGIFAVKVAYKLEQGELDEKTALDYTVDRAASVAKTVVEKKCEQVGEKLGEKGGAWLGGFLGSVLGPQAAVVGAKVGGLVGKAAGKKVGGLVGKGIDKLANGAKKVISTGCKGAKKACSAIGNAISRGWNSFCSLFS